MNRRLHPPLHLLRAFVSTAQLGTMSAASIALHLTQGAVSKQVLELEGWLGVTLFERVRKRVRLTPAGQRYLLAIQPLLLQLEAATLELMSSPADGGELHLSVLPTFGSKWLIPRLHDFQTQHPKVQLKFMPYVQGYDFHRPDLDCAIRYGDGAWPDAVSEYLMGREMSVIASPQLVAKTPFRRPADVVNHRLLQHLTLPLAWSQWCARHEVAGVNPYSGIQLDQYSAIIRGVTASLGVGLVPDCLIEDELASGAVVRPLPADLGRHEVDAGYFLCYPESKSSLAPLSDFRRWLQDMAAASRTEPPRRPARPRRKAAP